MTTHENAPDRESRALHELAAATASLLEDQDVIGLTTSLLAGCSRATGASAAGMLVVRPDDRRLELLSSTSHRVHELELYQLQIDEGPCIDAVKGLAAVSATGSRQLAVRWPSVARAFEQAGYQGVCAVPMVWRGEALGAVNLFFTDGGPLAEIIEVAQAFADMATIAIVHSGKVTAQDVVARSRAALDERIVIERAKGVIAYLENLPPEGAFERLLALVAARGRPLGEIAADVIDDAMRAD
jgi:GAF domain-containing protein